MYSTPRAPVDGTPNSSSSPSSSHKRRQRVDSNPLLPPVSGPEPKRARSGDVIPSHPTIATVTTTSTTSSSTPAATMSAKVSGKRPDMVDLTKQRGRGLPAFAPHAGARKLVIKNLRTAPRAADVESYYERTWAELQTAVEAILRGRKLDLPLERIYRGVEDICRNGQAQQLARSLTTRCEEYLYGEVLEAIYAEAKGLSDIDMLRVVIRYWNKWNKQTMLCRSTFSFLDRSFLLNHKVLPQIHDMAVDLFRRMLFSRKVPANNGKDRLPGDSVLSGMCQLIQQDRDGDGAFDALLLRESISMLHTFTYYGSRFEPMFLSKSDQYFRRFAEERTLSADLKSYINAVQGLLKREDFRCNTFNFESATKRQLLAKAHDILIAGYASKLLDQGSVTKLLDDNDVQSMRSLYELLRLSGIQKNLREPWEAYIQARGTNIVTDVARGDEMIIRLLELRRTLDVMIRDAFYQDDDFTYSLREAFGHFINGKKIASSWGTGTSKVGEMIAKYIDMLLRGGLKTLPTSLLSDHKDRVAAERSGQSSTADEDAELDRQLDQGLELFRFLEGKDVFEAFYKKDLARRLLMGRSASQDAERNMLSKLKSECGSSFTHNLEQMFKDQELGRDEMAAYKQWKEGTGSSAEDGGGGKMDLQVNILSASAWPSYPDVRLHLPPDVEQHITHFDRYYKNKHTGRRLAWKHNLAHCVVKARFNKGTKELLVSAFQAVVLLLFNKSEGGGGDDAEPLTYRHIAQSTGLEGGELARTLQSLACGRTRVLTKNPKGKDVNPDDTFTVNKAFTDPKVRVKINQIQLKETKEENKETHERVAADRQFETQAAIVRIMKSRKTLPHAQLVAEVISQTRSRGAMDPADIKQNIEKLIEKDYLEREGGSYVYLA